jgi:hypothetical protein
MTTFLYPSRRLGVIAMVTWALKKITNRLFFYLQHIQVIQKGNGGRLQCNQSPESNTKIYESQSRPTKGREETIEFIDLLS